MSYKYPNLPPGWKWEVLAKPGDALEVRIVPVWWNFFGATYSATVAPPRMTLARNQAECMHEQFMRKHFPAMRTSPDNEDLAQDIERVLNQGNV